MLPQADSQQWNEGPQSFFSWKVNSDNKMEEFGRDYSPEPPESNTIISLYYTLAGKLVTLGSSDLHNCELLNEGYFKLLRVW